MKYNIRNFVETHCDNSNKLKNNREEL